jgi:hypothetical protein
MSGISDGRSALEVSRVISEQKLLELEQQRMELELALEMALATQMMEEDLELQYL